MKELAEKLREEFLDKEYRHAYTGEFLNSYIATQIKVLREQRGWNQEQLAQEADMRQSRISVLENVNYSSWNITTLKRLAEAFDVTLNVSFESFGSRLRDIQRFGRESLERFSFDEDPAFQAQPSEELYASQAVREAYRELREPKLRDGNVFFLESYRKLQEYVSHGIPLEQRLESTPLQPVLKVVGAR